MKKKLLVSLTAMLAVFGLAFAATPDFDAEAWWNTNKAVLTQDAEKITTSPIEVSQYSEIKDALAAYAKLDDDDFVVLANYFAGIKPEPPYTASTFKAQIKALTAAYKEAANACVAKLISDIEGLDEKDPITKSEVDELNTKLTEWLTVKEDFETLASNEQTLKDAITAANERLEKIDAQTYLADLLRALLSNTDDDVNKMIDLFPTSFSAVTPEYSETKSLEKFKATTNQLAVAKLYVKYYELLDDAARAKAFETFAADVPKDYYTAAKNMADADEYLGANSDYANGTVTVASLQGNSESKNKTLVADLYRIMKQIGYGTPEVAPESDKEGFAPYVLKIIPVQSFYEAALSRYIFWQCKAQAQEIVNGFFKTYDNILETNGDAKTVTFDVNTTEKLYSDINTAISTIEGYYVAPVDPATEYTAPSVKSFTYETIGEGAYAKEFTSEESDRVTTGRYVSQTTEIKKALKNLKAGLGDATQNYYAYVLYKDWVNAYAVEGKVLAAKDYTIEKYAEDFKDFQNAQIDKNILNAKKTTNLRMTTSVSEVAPEGLSEVAIENWTWNGTSYAVENKGVADDWGQGICTIADGWIADTEAFTSYYQRNRVLLWINTYCVADGNIYEKVVGYGNAQLPSSLLTEINEATAQYTKWAIGDYTYCNPSAVEYYNTLVEATEIATADNLTIDPGLYDFSARDSEGNLKVLEIGDIRSFPKAAELDNSFMKLAECLTNENQVAYVDQKLTDTQIKRLPKNIIVKNSEGKWAANEIEFVDGSSYGFLAALTANKVTLKKSFNAGGLTPLFLPFSIPTDAFGDGYTVRYLNAAWEKENEATGVVTLGVNWRKNTNPATTALKPYVIEHATAEEPFTKEIILENVEIAATYNTSAKTVDVPVVCNTTTATVSLSGVSLPIEIGTVVDPAKLDGSYMIAASKGVWSRRSEIVAPAGRLILNIETTGGASYVIRHTFVEDDEATSIENVSSEAKPLDGIYTINGVKVNNTSKPGLYIINGKKVMVK